MAELLLDMNFLAQEPSTIPRSRSCWIAARRHEKNTQYRDLHARYLALASAPAWVTLPPKNPTGICSRTLPQARARLIPVLRTFLEKRRLQRSVRHEATAFHTAALSLALSTIENEE